MDFSEQAVAQLDIGSPDGVIELLSKLCGQGLSLGCPCGQSGRCGECSACRSYAKLTTLCNAGPWNRAKLNQALLLLNQPTVSLGFYGQFFIAGNGAEDLKQGVIHFRGMAMLRFGNFRFAFKSLCGMSEQDISRALEPYSITSGNWAAYYRNRPKAHCLVEEIDDDKKWHLGYISGTLAEGDFITIIALKVLLGGSKEEALALLDAPEQRSKLEKRLLELSNVDPGPLKAQLTSLNDQVDQMQRDIPIVQAVGASNTVGYLSSEYLDVYVATSMRESWEYEDTSNFVRQVLAHRDVAALNLIHFDPTLSYCQGRC